MTVALHQQLMCNLWVDAGSAGRLAVAQRPSWGSDGSKYTLADFAIIRHVTINTGV